jgi:hypothetical protein
LDCLTPFFRVSQPFFTLFVSSKPPGQGKFSKISITKKKKIASTSELSIKIEPFADRVSGDDCTGLAVCFLAYCSFDINASHYQQMVRSSEISG